MTDSDGALISYATCTSYYTLSMAYCIEGTLCKTRFHLFCFILFPTSIL